MAAVKQTDFALYRRLLRQARPYWPHIGGVFFLSLLSTPLALLTPLPLKIVVDSVSGAQPFPHFLHPVLPTTITNSPTNTLILAVSLVIVIEVLVHLQGLGLWVLQTYTGEKLVLDFRSQLFRHAQRLSLSYHDTKGASDSLYRILYDAYAIQNTALSGVIPFFTSGLTLIAMIYVTARIDWHLALIALAVSPLLFMLTQVSRKRLRRRWAEVKEVESSAMAVVQEVLAAVRVVKAFGQEDREQQRFLHHARQGLRGHIHVAFLGGGFDFLVGVTLAGGTAAALFVGAHHVQVGVLTLGELLMVMAYLAQLYRPLQTITKQVAGLQSALASAGRAFALFDEVPDVVEHANARDVTRASGSVVFQEVSFAYDEAHPVLHDISFAISPGARVGVVGTTGAGKTTLISLLLRFYDPTAGRILLDEVDVRDYRLADLRNQFALVLQEPVLFSTSIAENIAYARPDASEAEIIEAATAANAHEFIVRLPDGYDTLVGERGMRLSGGERQRIALARAFLKNAPILILDEPTSAVDVKTEAAIIEAMERLMHGRTTFIITHRLSALRHCDVTLHIENGRLREQTPAVSWAEGETVNQWITALPERVS
jgi:ATP-binding cassette subfamily B protein